MAYVTENAAALRVIRIDERRNEFINYEAMTFPKGPAAGCDMYLRRLAAFGFLLSKDDISSNLAVDILDGEGDIIDTFPISSGGFLYLRGRLRFRREQV